MKIKIQKRLAAQVLKCSESNVRLDPDRLEEIKEAITKADIKSLIKDKAIIGKKRIGTSKYRIRKNQAQKSKGRRKGHGSRKSGVNARISKKRRWANHIRTQRSYLQNLRDKDAIDRSGYRSLYMKSKGGFFRSKRHLKIYMEENGFIKK